VILAAASSADEVNLVGGRRVTGTVTAIHPDGATTLRTSFAKAPLVLRADAVLSINLTAPDNQNPAARPHALILRNDDVIPCEVVGMDAEQVRIHAAALGELSVPRDAVRAIRFGLRTSKSILAPPEAYKNWAASEAWKATDTSLTSSAVGNTSRDKLKLPPRFVLRCRLEWQGYPNLRFQFADNHLEATGRADRYFLTFNHAGLELKRQCSSGRTYHSLAPIPKSPDSFGGTGNTSGFDLEIRVDRPARSIQLLINGESQGTFRDPADEAPSGNGLMLLSYASGTNRNIIRNLEINEWLPGTESPATGLPAPADADTISVHNAPDTMSGTAQSIRIEDGKPAVVFQSPHAEQPLVVTNTALLCLRKPAQDKPGDGNLAIELAGNGKLTARACSLAEATTTAEHPLLGQLKLQRSEIRAISRATPQPADPPQPQ
jgi:hypothetical protein